MPYLYDGRRPLLANSGTEAKTGSGLEVDRRRLAKFVRQPSGMIRAKTVSPISAALLLPGKGTSSLAADGQGERQEPKAFAEDKCRIIEKETLPNGLPVSFFARLVWR